MSEVFSHDEMHRILSRASRLHDDGQDGSLDGDRYDLQALIEAAAEMGVARDAVIEAVALERLGAEPVPRRLDRVVGAATVVVERRVPIPATVALERLDDWLVRGHHLRRESRSGSRVVWHKRSDLVAGFHRELKAFGGGATLGGVSRLEAVVSPLAPELTAVRLLADRHVDRTIGLALGGGVGAGSAVGGVIALVVAPPLALIAIPGFVVAGGVTTISRVSGTRTAREMSILLDQLAAGESRPTLTRGIARRLGFRV